MPLLSRPPVPRAHSEAHEAPLTEIHATKGTDGHIVGTACYSLDIAGEYDELNRYFYSVTADLTGFKIGDMFLSRTALELIAGKDAIDALCTIVSEEEELKRNTP